MKEAGLDTVRMRHLAWDSFEPRDGIYTFEWFDEVMDLFHEAGIRVVLDISLRLAPIWVHRICPGCNIGSKSGIMQESLHHYMEDLVDPEYQFYTFRFAQKMMEHFRTHPAVEVCFWKKEYQNRLALDGYQCELITGSYA